MKKIILLGMFLFLILPIDISAQEVEYYTNHYGVKFSKKEYEFISNFYFDGYQDYMTEKDYNQFIESDIINGVINTIVSDSENLSKELIHETTMKILKVSSSCSSDCYVVTTLTWKSNPSVRSYDLIGAFLNGTSLNGNVSAKMYYDSSQASPKYSNKSSNGLSSTFKLPSTSKPINFVQEFRVQKREVLMYHINMLVKLFH